jgi:hypothetical protein
MGEITDRRDAFQHVEGFEAELSPASWLIYEDIRQPGPLLNGGFAWELR